MSDSAREEALYSLAFSDAMLEAHGAMQAGRHAAALSSALVALASAEKRGTAAAMADVAMAAGLAADCHMALGDHNKALRMATRRCEAASASGRGSLEHCQAQLGLADVLLACDMYDRVAETVRPVLELLAALPGLGPDHSAVVDAELKMASSLRETRRFALAVPHYERALAAMGRRGEAGDEGFADKVVNLSICLTCTGRFAYAEQKILQAREIYETVRCLTYRILKSGESLVSCMRRAAPSRRDLFSVLIVADRNSHAFYFPFAHRCPPFFLRCVGAGTLRSRRWIQCCSIRGKFGAPPLAEDHRHRHQRDSLI